VAIRRSFAEDLYIVMPSNDPSTISSQLAPLEIVVNPLVNWIWFGFGVLALGTGIALLPERAYSFAVAKLPAEAATTAGAVLLVLLLGGPAVSAQTMGAVPPGVDVQTSYYPRTDFEKQMQHEIRCTCGCGHIAIGECRKDPCVTSHEMRGQVATLIDEGKTHDEIIGWFVNYYGNQQMLGAPMDEGFSRLAWLFPYLAGLGGAVALGFVATRWSHRTPEGGDAAAPETPEMEERLDDELRNLD